MFSGINSSPINDRPINGGLDIAIGTPVQIFMAGFISSTVGDSTNITVYRNNQQVCYIMDTVSPENREDCIPSRVSTRCC